MNKLLQGDCLELMKSIPDKSIDMILADLPFGITQNKKDIKIDFELLWNHYERIIKYNGVIVLFGQNKFTIELIISNFSMYKYSLIWNKILSSGFLNANKQPLRIHEDICIFYKKQPTYNPQKVKGKENHSKGSPKKNKNNNYGDFDFIDNKNIQDNLKFPTSILSFEKPHPSITINPTQKPVKLFEYLIKTYTNEGDLILDNVAGSMTTAIAAINTDRNYICMEMDEEMFEKGKKRVEEHLKFKK
jgi:site-specific DNA-methyltransferase (adenine-specific)